MFVRIFLIILFVKSLTLLEELFDLSVSYLTLPSLVLSLLSLSFCCNVVLFGCVEIAELDVERSGGLELIGKDLCLDSDSFCVFLTLDVLPVNATDLNWLQEISLRI